MSGGYLALGEKGKLIRSILKTMHVQKKGKHKGKDLGEEALVRGANWMISEGKKLSIPDDLVDKYIDVEQKIDVPRGKKAQTSALRELARLQGVKRPRKKAINRKVNPYLEFVKNVREGKIADVSPPKEGENPKEFLIRVGKVWSALNPSIKKERKKRIFKKSEVVEQLMLTNPKPKKERKKRAKKARKQKVEVLGITVQKLAEQHPDVALSDIVAVALEPEMKKMEKEAKRSAIEEFTQESGLSGYDKEEEALYGLELLKKYPNPKTRKALVKRGLKHKFGHGF